MRSTIGNKLVSLYYITNAKRNMLTSLHELAKQNNTDEPFLLRGR